MNAYIYLSFLPGCDFSASFFEFPPFRVTFFRKNLLKSTARTVGIPA
jgi:hypothetical protein